MKNILCYGDSNTFGWDPDTITRFDETARWTRLLAKKLGEDYYVIEEGLGGRTATLDDTACIGRNGREYLIPCIQSHQPLDLFVLMLGTNDMKATYALTPADIGRGIEELLKIIKNPYNWDNLQPPKVLLISPILVGLNIRDTFFGGMFGNERAVETSIALAPIYQELAKRYDCEFLDASRYAQPSKSDAIHLNKENHKKLADTVYNAVKTII